jgi:Predicted membrane protein (DUF2306).
MKTLPLPSPTILAFDKLLRGCGVIWFVVAAIGQLAFIGFILAYYGVRTVTMNLAAWNDKPLIDGYVAGDNIGNLTFAIHVLLASVMILFGLIQLVPHLRRANPRLHRWSGRLFLSLATIEAVSGVWLTLVRGTYLSGISAVAILFNASLILVFGTLTWRSAVRRRYGAHQLWAMRAFLAASGVWFLRVGFMGWVLINQGPVGMNDHMSGPADIVVTFGSSLIPLALFELYRAAGNSRRISFKGIASLVIAVATLFTAVGVFGTVALMWWPYLA